MRKSFKYLLSVLFTFLFLTNTSQDHGFFNQVWLEQGLSQSSIVGMIQDKKGFMWFATQDGLNRYDGRNIDHFNFKPFDKQSISGDFIYSISLVDNTLYVLSDKGLDAIDLATLNITNLKSKNEKENKTVFFKSWSVNGSLYLFSRNGLARVKADSAGTFDLEYCNFVDSVKSETNLLVNSLCSDKNQNLYAATNKGIFAQKKQGTSFSKIYELLPASGFRYENERYYSTVACNNGKLFFTNASTLFWYNIESKTTFSLSLKSYSSLTSIIIDKQNKIWIGTNSKGLLVIQEKECDSLCVDKHFVRNNNSRFTLQSNEITSLYQNPESTDGIVWIGTRDAGAFNYSYSKNSFSIPTSFVNSSDLNFFGLTKDKDGVIWAGFNSGILKVDRSKKSHHIIDLSDLLNKIDRPVEAICCDAENNVWTAIGNSLYLIDRKNNSLITKVSPLVPERTNQVSRIVILNNEELALCTLRGIIIYNKLKNTTRLINSIEIKGKKQTLENVVTLLVDSKNNWWVGGANGICCIRANKDNFILRHDNADSNSILSNRIMDIKESRNGDILVGTTKGLTVIRGYGEQIRNIYQAKGLSNNYIYGLLEDNSGKFWMSTNFGISVFNPSTGGFISYTASDGICINEFNSEGYYKADDGELIFGGLGGVVSIYPERQVVNRSVSDIVLRKLKIEGYPEPIDSNKTLSLSYWQNDMNFEFSAPDYSGERSLNLYYRFKNKDTSWIKVNTSQLLSLAFINLAPGKYNLEVVALNKAGARSKPFYLSFVVHDPFWSTWWFYLILVLLTVFMSWVIYRSRLKMKINYIQQIER